MISSRRRRNEAVPNNTDLLSPLIQRDAPIGTWFGVGGRADRLCAPATHEQLKRMVREEPDLLILGDGANLLVDDDGVDRLVISLSEPCFKEVKINQQTGVVRVGAGASLPKLLTELARKGLAGLEGLAGIPATVGGAVVMNAGGARGDIGDVVSRVFALRRDGFGAEIGKSQLAFDYRQSAVKNLILTEVEFKLRLDKPEDVRARLKEAMAYKKKTQPLADRSAGCCFKNPTLTETIEDIAEAGQRVSAGLLLDRAGCKGLEHGGVKVSERHANFFSTIEGATARDVLRLMSQCQKRVMEEFGVKLEPEVVIWRRENRA